MKKNLRTGFTTGTAAAAAAKGALALILEGKEPTAVQIKLLTGDEAIIPVHRCRRESDSKAICSVIKDAGDDPDVTHKAEIGAIVTLQGPSVKPLHGRHSQITISGGQGVGIITKPGLELPPGEPAINPGPRRMIAQALQDILTKHGRQQGVHVEIFVPQGEKIAEKTLNARLGIIGGISILGTTGIVRPMSHEAFIATIESALSVARASGFTRVVLTTGRRSERFAQKLWPQQPAETFVQMGDFFQMSLQAAASRGFAHIAVAVFFGKALKIAQGMAHTHAAKSRLTMTALSEWVLQLTRDRLFSEKILCAHTARHAFDIIWPHYPEVVSRVGEHVVKSAQRFAGRSITIQCVIFDYNGTVVFESEKNFSPFTLNP
jgi:cobalt-precorrin-5B (C1)-methyltransferase